MKTILMSVALVSLLAVADNAAAQTKRTSQTHKQNSSAPASQQQKVRSLDSSSRMDPNGTYNNNSNNNLNNTNQVRPDGTIPVPNQPVPPGTPGRTPVTPDYNNTTTPTTPTSPNPAPNQPSGTVMPPSGK